MPHTDTDVPSTIDVVNMEGGGAEPEDNTATSSIDSAALVRRLQQQLKDVNDKKRKLDKTIKKQEKKLKTMQRVVVTSMRQSTGKSNARITKMTLKELESGYGSSAKIAIEEAIRYYKRRVLPRNKVLSTDWQEFDENKKGTLCQVLMKKVKTKENGVDDRFTIWAAHLVPVIKSILHVYRNKVTKGIKEQFRGKYIPFVCVN
jgi:hypothetical protein